MHPSEERELESRSSVTYDTSEARRLRDEARELDAKREESFQRCDTDGFLSQWAHGVNAAKARKEAELIERGGVADFVSLHYAATGERVRAKLVELESRYTYGKVSTWLVLDANERVSAYVPAFKSGPRSKLAKLGLEERRETVPAKVELLGSSAVNVAPYFVRLDDGFPAEARTLDQIRRDPDGEIGL